MGTANSRPGAARAGRDSGGADGAGAGSSGESAGADTHTHTGAATGRRQGSSRTAAAPPSRPTTSGGSARSTAATLLAAATIAGRSSPATNGSPGPSGGTAEASSSGGASAVSAAAVVGAAPSGRRSPNDALAGEDIPAGATETERMSWFAMAKMGYNAVVNAIIRPPRAKYIERDLGPLEFEFRGRVFRRTDLEVRNSRGMRIVCSHWEPAPFNRPVPQLPCVIYLHGNSSCRIGCLENLEVVLGEGCTMFAFDFTGSGMSEGDYVTLGWHEKEDLAATVDYLRRCGSVSSIALWGRSMGAATALMHAPRDPSIAGMVLDSPFADLRQLAIELVEMGKSQTGYKVPGFVVGAAIRMVRSSVMKKTGMDIFTLRPIAEVDKAFTPALFVAGEGDNFIAPHHSRQIHEKYAGDKNLVLVPGDHNSLRPRFFQDSAAIFLRTVLQIPAAALLEDTGRLTPGSRSLLATMLGAGAGSRARKAARATHHRRTAEEKAAGAPGGPTADGVVVPGTGSASSAEEELSHAAASGAHRSHRTLESAWRDAAGDDSIDAAAAARAANAAAEEEMIQQALLASMLTATVGGVRADAPAASPMRPPAAPVAARPAATASAAAAGPRTAGGAAGDHEPPTPPASKGPGDAGHSGRGSEYLSERASPAINLDHSLRTGELPSGTLHRSSHSRGDAAMEAAMESLADPGGVLTRRPDEPKSTRAASTRSGWGVGPLLGWRPRRASGGRGDPDAPGAAQVRPPPIHAADALVDQIAAGFAEGLASPSPRGGITPSSDRDAELQRAIALSLAAAGGPAHAVSQPSKPAPI